MKYLLAIIALICLPAGAQTIGIHTASVHVPQHEQTNSNWGIYARSTSGVEAGIYRNSIGRTGGYLSQQFDLIEGSAGKLAVQIGAAYGYQKRCLTTTTTTGKMHQGERMQARTITSTECGGFSRGAITPMAGFTYTAPMAVMGITPRIQFLPAFSKHSSVFHLTLEKAL